jgi:hypothetical protein
MVLRSALLAAVKTRDAVLGVENDYGQRYIVDFEFENVGKTASLRSVWIVEAGSEIPRLVTCLVL